MIFEASEFVFYPPPAVARARRVLIKPSAAYPLPHPVTTSRETLEVIIAGVRRVSDADILLLEGTPQQTPVTSVYQALGYDFPRVLTLDVKDCFYVEVENPLSKPFAVANFWVPSVVLSCDYLITVAPLKLFGNRGSLSVMNLLGLLPVSKYRGEAGSGWGSLYGLGIDRVVADLSFTIPFDLGVVDARRIFVGTDDPTRGEIKEYGKIFVGEPYEVDCQVSEVVGAETGYLPLIKEGRLELQL